MESILLLENPKDKKNKTIWSNYYNKTIDERHVILKKEFPEYYSSLNDKKKQLNDKENKIQLDDNMYSLPLSIANLMIENCIGVFNIPLGLGLNFIIDKKKMVIPMVIEEPSVIAAASSAAKTICSNGNGFITKTTENIMTCQIQLLDINNIKEAVQLIYKNKKELIEYANNHLCYKMKKRGGGVIDLYIRTIHPLMYQTEEFMENIPYVCNIKDMLYRNNNEFLFKPQILTQNPFLVVHLDVDVCDAMGANIVNTIAEGLSFKISSLVNARSGLNIVSNLCIQRRARSEFEIPVELLKNENMDGYNVALRIIEASDFAILDPYRAVTNNKGIMNGIDAVCIATGQDWRAVEAAAHCYASRGGRYSSLSSYSLISQKENNKIMYYLKGSLELPISVGTKGGTVSSHPCVAANLTLLHHPDAKQLAGIITSVGLAQNFAAIRALATTGIQKGHMALHARNIAMAAGATTEIVPDVCRYMLQNGEISLKSAKKYLFSNQQIL